jgi:DNA-binding transcriptional LysR family regulator
MNLNRLRYFVAVVEAGSIRKAAQLLHLTPAALSKAVDQLSRETGVELLVPDGRGIRPTARGLAIAHHARRVLDEAALLEAFAANSAASRAIVRIGTQEIFGTYFFGQLVGALDPEVAVTVHSTTPGETEQAVADGTVDVGLTFVPVAHDQVEHVTLGSVATRVYARAGAFEGEPFENVPFVIPSRRLTATAARASTSDGWPLDGPLRNVVYQVGTIEAALELARQGRAAVYLPEFVAELHGAQVKPRYRLVPLAQAEAAASTLEVAAVRAVSRPPTVEAHSVIDAARVLVERFAAPAARNGSSRLADKQA